ncbi:MAG: EamA family transporter [Ilumatobacter sp.]|nr:EamA family transporter [Ilumatobacter sp.]
MFRSVARAFVGEEALTERQGAVLVAAAGVVFSFTAIAYRAVESASDWQFLAYRGASTTAAMMLLIVARSRHRPVPFHETNGRVVAAAVLLSTVSMLYILALARASAATTLFLLAAAPIFAAIIGWLALRERVERPTLIAIGLTGVGIAIMVGSGLDAGSGIGVLFAALIPLLVGGYNVVLRSAGHVDPVIPTLISGALLTVGAGAVALATDGLGVSGRDALLACVTGGFALGVGLPMFNLGHRSVASARVSLLLMTEVVLAPLWVWIWPGEQPRASTLIGGAIVLGTVVWLLTRAEAAVPDDDALATVPSV